MTALFTSDENNSINEIQDFETHDMALYNQEIIQMLCSDTLELEIELAQDVVSSFICSMNFVCVETGRFFHSLYYS